MAKEDKKNVSIDTENTEVVPSNEGKSLINCLRN